MLYSDIVGQSEAKRRLMKMVRDDRVPHALMFTGGEGSGNLPAATAFAQHLLCTNRTENGPCNQCPSCLKTSKLIHPDLHLVYPIAKLGDIKTSGDVIGQFREIFLRFPYLGLGDLFKELGTENKQPGIHVEEAAEILNKLSFTSYEGSYKIMIIWQPEKMNAGAANKLLKILEEPPDKTIFILVSDQPDKLLPTIISRVQQVPFFQCSDEEITEALKKDFNANENTARQVAVMSEGNYRTAARLIEEADEGVSLLNQFQTFMRIAFRLDGIKAADWVDEHSANGREQQKQFIQYGLQVFRDCLMFNYGSKDLVKLSGQEKQFIEKFAPFINQNNYQTLVERFNESYYHIERNANSKILFMDLLLNTNELLNRK